MKEHPILFSAPMVVAILGSRKTVTRRVVKPQPRTVDGVPDWKSVRCPYGQPGDRLWVREAWRTYRGNDKTPPRELTTAHRIWFEADEPINLAAGKLRPSMFMPRWASRITLEVTGVRVERLQDISSADCWAEGIPHSPDVDPVHEYRELWESINGPESWAANPWVWCVSFKRLEA